MNMKKAKQTLAILIVAAAGVFALGVVASGCSGKVNLKQDLQTASGVVSAVDQSPACTWIAIIANDPSAGTICKEVLDGLAGATGIAATVASRRLAGALLDGGAGAMGYKELRVNGVLKGLLRPDVWLVVMDMMSAPGAKK